MGDGFRRFAAFQDAERSTLLAAAQRARALDHKTNRGSDFERAVRDWMSGFVEPEYTVSQGEVIDSFGASGDEDNRQRDLIVHQNTRHARRFTFGDDLRLVPIEAVALLIEVKLLIDAEKFKVADKAASAASKLRLAVDRITHPINEDRELGHVAAEGRVRGPKEGEPVATVYKRVWHGVVAADGPAVETLASWVTEGKTIDFVCCLSTGCAFRQPFARGKNVHPVMAFCDVSPADRSLVHLGRLIHLSLDNFEHKAKATEARYGGYEPYMSVRYYDSTGYATPTGVTRLPAENDELKRMGKGPKNGRSQRKETAKG